MAKARRTSKPISPSMHGLLDYGLAASNLLVPRAFGMSRRARRLFAAFGLVQGGLNALTVQPFAVSRVVPFPLHGTIDKSSAPLFFALPPLLGLTRQRKACVWWLLTGAALVTVYNLTDWGAEPTSR